jgi:hypothetical protein
MDARDFIIVGLLGGGAWWLWRKRQATPQVALTSTPLSAASYTPTAALSTQSGPLLWRGLAQPAIPASPLFNIPRNYSGMLFKSQANALVAADNSPPLPPAAPNAFFSSMVGGLNVGGRGSSTMGTNPQINLRIQ